MADIEPHVFDAALTLARVELVENAPPLRWDIGESSATHALYAVRLRLLANRVEFEVVPQRIERVIGFRAFVDDTVEVAVVSVVADMREHVRVPFDLTRWAVARGYTPYDMGLVSWLFPLTVVLERRVGEPLLDVMVVTENSPDPKWPT